MKKITNFGIYVLAVLACWHRATTSLDKSPKYGVDPESEP